MADNVTGQSSDIRVFHGNMGVTSDFYYLDNGNIPNGTIKLQGQDDETQGSFSGNGAMVTVVGHFFNEVLNPDSLSISDSWRHFIVARWVPHTAVAEGAFAIFASGTGGTAEQNWLLAERDLLRI